MLNQIIHKDAEKINFLKGKSEEREVIFKFKEKFRNIANLHEIFI